MSPGNDKAESSNSNQKFSPVNGKKSKNRKALISQLVDESDEVTPWSKYKRREYDVIFVKPTGSTKMAVKLRLLTSIL